MLKYTILENGIHGTLSFEGDIDIDVTDIISAEVVPLLKDFHELTIDFMKVYIIDSTGVRMLIQLIKELKGSDKKVKIINLNPYIEEVFSLLHIQEIIGQDVFV